jgi:hypothetical protein
MGFPPANSLARAELGIRQSTLLFEKIFRFYAAISALAVSTKNTTVIAPEFAGSVAICADFGRRGRADESDRGRD